MFDYMATCIESKAWKRMRRNYLLKRRSQSKDNNIYCERCGEKYAYTICYKKPLSLNDFYNGKEMLDKGNIEAVCKRCHDLEHTFTRVRR